MATKHDRKQLHFVAFSLMIGSINDKEAMMVSSPKSYLPMLTGLMLGDAISSHDGVSCYPAIRHSNQDKYILKVISVPASQVQTDAMLLTGAFPNREAAMQYYMDMARDMLRETEILRQLSHQEGFIPYLDGQIIGKDDLNGYDVYLLSEFRYSLEQILQNENLTHKQIMRIGLDLCAALAACRREGYLYMDLKPANVFYSEAQGYRIGDIGFASLASLPYSSLPVQYRSTYTAPELLDEMAVLNSTVDVYALGLILYQAYNGGVLPNIAPGTLLPTPSYADYELAEIILKACHQDPAARWTDPAVLAQALISYMQRNPVSDEAIIPIVAETMEEEPAYVEEFLPEASAEELEQEIAALEGTEYEEMAFINALGSSESTDSEMMDHDGLALSDEISLMLAQADDLIAHELPEPPVAPAPIDVPMPERIRIEPEENPKEEPAEEPSPEKELLPEETTTTEIPHEVPSEPEATPEEQKTETTAHRPFPWRILALACVILALMAAAMGGYYFHQHYYLQTIDRLSITQTGDVVSVEIAGDVDNSLLTVICSDSYGNSYRQSVVAGIAIFPDLHPQTHYSIRLEISGWHKLAGSTVGSITTAAQTFVTSLSAGIGNHDGSVLLQFQTEGPAVDKWIVTYYPTAHPALQISLPFQGNSVEIPGLQIDSEYIFVLSRADGLSISGHTETKYIAAKIILAQNPQIIACANGSLTVQWTAPENTRNTLWIVRCYNASGYDQRITTGDLTATFENLTHDVPCTVEITAQDMKQSTQITVPAEPVTIGNFSFTENGNELTVSWQYSGQANAGWMLEYTIDGQMQPAQRLESNRVIVPLIPGSIYTFQVEAVDVKLQFGGSETYESAEAELFDQWGIRAEDVEGMLCLRPEVENWTAADVSDDLYASVFSALQQAGLVLHTENLPDEVSETINVQLVIRDAFGNLIAVTNLCLQWDILWIDGSCALDLPSLPTECGEYTVSVYFGGKRMGQWTFSVEETE